MSTARGRKRRVVATTPEGEHLALRLRGACDCPGYEARWLRAERRARELYQRALELEHEREVLALARRILEGAWDQEHAPRVWVSWDGRGWAAPWARAWAGYRSARERWVAQRLARLATSEAGSLWSLPTSLTQLPLVHQPRSHPRAADELVDLLAKQ